MLVFFLGGGGGLGVFSCILFYFIFSISFCKYVFTCNFLADVSQGYQPLIDGGRKHDFEKGNYKCDDTLNGWYRFQGAAGPKMVTICPPMNRCDVSYPIWWDGNHPTVVEGTVTRIGCINKSNCCDNEVAIQVKNYSLYYIYKFTNLGHCNTRYCTTD